MSDPAVPHGIGQGSGHVLLAPNVGEALGTETPVQGLVGLFGLRGWLIGHEQSDYGTTVTVNPAVWCDGQAICGTQHNPLRAAAVRP